MPAMNTPWHIAPDQTIRLECVECDYNTHYYSSAAAEAAARRHVTKHPTHMVQAHRPQQKLYFATREAQP